MEKKKRPVFKISCLFAFTILLPLLAHSVFAETKTFEKEYTYQASEEDSRNSSRTISLREVKKLLLEELGTYLESITEVKSFRLTKDQITTLTGGIVRTEIANERWDGKVYWLKAKISADPNDVIKSIDTLRKDRDKTLELEETRERASALLQENERLRKELESVKGEKAREAKQKYTRNIQQLGAAEWFEKGLSYALSGNYDDAIKAFRNAIELNPQFVDAYNNIGWVLNKLENYQEAIEYLNKAIVIDPLYTRPYYNRILAYGKLGNHQQAIDDYTKLIEYNPYRADDYYGRGLSYGMLKEHRRAIQDFSKVLELNPNNVDAYALRGYHFTEINDYQQAMKDLNKALELDPKSRGAYSFRGDTYIKTGEHSKAISDYKHAAQLGNSGAQKFLTEHGISWTDERPDQATLASKQQEKTKEQIRPKPQTAPSLKTEYADFLFELKGCRSIEDHIECDIMITNKSKDRMLEITCVNEDIPTRIFDSDGYEYRSQLVRFGSMKGEKSKTKLVNNIPARAVIVFEKMTGTPQQLTLIEVAFIDADNNNFRVWFKNIPLSSTKDTSTKDIDISNQDIRGKYVLKSYKAKTPDGNILTENDVKIAGTLELEDGGFKNRITLGTKTTAITGTYTLFYKTKNSGTLSISDDSGTQVGEFEYFNNRLSLYVKRAKDNVESWATWEKIGQ